MARGLADREGSALMLRHFEQMLRSVERLEHDMRGGETFGEAMRQYA
jgi:hypothetical protein